MKKYMNSICCMLILLLMAPVVDITPKAYYELLGLAGKTHEAWITDEIYKSEGDSYTIVKGGTPEGDIDDYYVVEVQEVKLYIPNYKNNPEMNIVEFRRKNGGPELGVLEPRAF